MKSISNEILINASLETVWDALVNPIKTKVYMYGCEALTDWKAGSKLDWQGEYEGKKMVFVSGKVVEIDAPHFLHYTTIDPNAAYAQSRANALDVRYYLSKSGEQTLLKVYQFGFEHAADAEKRFADIDNKGLGWTPVLEQIKSLCEKE